MFGAMDLIPKLPSGGPNQTQARLRDSPRKPYPETRPMKKHSASSTADRGPAILQFSGALIKTFEPKVEGPDFPKARPPIPPSLQKG